MIFRHFVIFFFSFIVTCRGGSQQVSHAQISNSEHASEISSSAAEVPTETLLRQHPLQVLQRAFQHYRRMANTTSFTCIKQERIDQELLPTETIRVLLREQPYAVRMTWLEGARTVAGTPITTVSYQAGENKGCTVVHRPEARLAFLRLCNVPPHDAQARATSRYSITEASLGHTIERTHRAWSAAHKAGNLHVEYLGKRAVAELDGKLCHVLKRKCDVPECDPFLMSEPLRYSPADGAAEITIYLDSENYLQLGAVLTRLDGQLLGRYFFKDVNLNAKVTANDFVLIP